MMLTGSKIPGFRLLVIGLLVALPCAALPGPGRVESDPSVISILPKSYPLNRMRVAAHEYPWSAIGLVTLLGGRYRCTGTLIAEQYVLTAAHCVFFVRNFPEEIHFLGGYEQDRYVAHARARRLHLSRAFKNRRPSPEAFAGDWALIELEKPIGKSTGYLGWASFDADRLENIGKGTVIFKISGYRRDRGFVQTVDHECQITGFTADHRLIKHRCPMTGGDSGGPLLMSYQNRWFVVGIDVGVRGPQPGAGETREGYAVPAATFQDKLLELGIGGAPIDVAGSLAGHPGKPPGP